MELRLHQFDLPLRHTFTISRGSTDVQKTLIVELHDDGLCGYGEATTNDFYGATIDNMIGTLEAVRGQIEGYDFQDPAAFWQELDVHLQTNRFAQCALDQAVYDLWGKRRGQPLHKLWGLTTDKIPLSNYTIGIDKVDVMIEKMREFADWPIFKIKLGTANDLEIVQQLREHTDAVFRVDANCGWRDADEVIRNAKEFKELNVEFIEQPLPPGEGDEMLLAAADSVLPIVADESCELESDVERCAEQRFHAVNIKLVKCGGITPARRMIERARQLGLKVMIGCMTESTVGISAIAQLLPLLDYVDMDGAALLSMDIASGAKVEKGKCKYPAENGCGVKLIEK